jgi:hypothetical protein
MEAATAWLLVSEKMAGVASAGDTFAVTLYGPPTVPLAVKTADVATPDALVVAVFAPPAKLPLGPLTGGVKITTTLGIGWLAASSTVATRGALKAIFRFAL